METGKIDNDFWKKEEQIGSRYFFMGVGGYYLHKTNIDPNDPSIYNVEVRADYLDLNDVLNRDDLMTVSELKSIKYIQPDYFLTMAIGESIVDKHALLTEIQEYKK